jgi:hypothetical protein
LEYQLRFRSRLGEILSFLSASPRGNLASSITKSIVGRPFGGLTKPKLWESHVAYAQRGQKIDSESLQRMGTAQEDREWGKTSGAEIAGARFYGERIPSKDLDVNTPGLESPFGRKRGEQCLGVPGCVVPRCDLPLWVTKPHETSPIIPETWVM